MEKDTLVIILNETRAHETTGMLMMKNVIHKLNADLALCVGINENTDRNNIFYKSAKYIWETQQTGDLGDLYDEIKIKEKSDKNWREILNVPHGDLMGGVKSNHKGSGAFCIYNRYILYKKIIELALDTKYKWFIITRSDFIWNIPHPPTDILDINRIYIPDGEYYAGFTDRHMIVSYKYVKKCINLMEPIIHRPEWLFQLLIQEQKINIEALIKIMLIQNNICKYVHLFPYVMYTIREKNGPSNWANSTGTYNEELGYFIKYDNEYKLYKHYKDKILNDNDWINILKIYSSLSSITYITNISGECRYQIN